MKLYVTLVQVLALLALIGTTLGDDEVTSPRVCTVKLERGKVMHQKIAETAIRCLATDGKSIAQLNAIDSLEGHKEFFKGVCDKGQQIRECLAGVEQKSEVCQNQTRHKFFLIFRELLETLLDSGCIQDGEVLASVFMNYNTSAFALFKSDSFHDCMNTAMERTILLLDKDVEPHSRFFIFYREVVNSKECFGSIAEVDLTLMKAIESILGDIANKLKCVRPQDETTVLCKSIDTNLPDVPRICPIKSQDEEISSLTDTLIKGVSWCVSSSFLDTDKGLNLIKNLETSHAFFQNNCQKKMSIKNCMSEVVTLSSVCLPETQHNAVMLVEDVILRGLEFGCVDNGSHLAYVLYKVLSATNATLQHNAVRTCINIAHPQHDEEVNRHIDAARVLRFHQHLNQFKGCLINKLIGDNKAVFHAEFFLAALKRSMKCLGPEHGTMVLCETINTAPPTEVKVCPFVGEHENEPPKYEMFVEQGFKCIKASTLDLTGVQHFTSIEEFRTLFNLFCHNRTSIKHCLADVSSNSEVCQNQTNHQMLNIFTDFYGTGLETGCKQDGDVLATILNGFMNDAEKAVDIDLLRGCEDTAGAQINHAISTSDTVSAKTLLGFQAIASFKECVLNATSEVGSFKNVFGSFMNDILRSTKCLSPDHGSTVLCETIVNTR